MTSAKLHEVCCAESFKWYLPGVIALNESRRYVQDKCRSVVMSHLPALADAIRAVGTPLSMLDYPTPGDTPRTGREDWMAEAGVKVRRTGTDVFSAHVWWGTQRGKEEEGVWEDHPHGVQVWIWSKQKSDTDAVYRTLVRSVSPRWEHDQLDNRTIYRWREMPLAKMPQFDRELDALVADTIRLIKKSGAFRTRKAKRK